jgi:4-amino-4-deoxy-L-arabinose transferase-like glycosyltransferase
VAEGSPDAAPEVRVLAWASSRPAAVRAGVALWALAIGALFLLRLGAAPLFDVDEGAFAEATREMLAGGDFGSTTLNGAARFDKPILVYWLQAASVALLGLDEAALRLPSALCAWLWSLAVARFAWTRFGARVALLAGTLLATSVGVLAIGRAATADALLNLLLALALLDGWRHLENGAAAPLRRAYLWIGLGLLAKGPVALVVPAAAMVLHCAASREWRRLARVALDGPGWAILLATAAPWYAYALHRHGAEFVDGFLVRHNVARYTSVLEGHGGSLGYYLLMLPVLLLPWSALLPDLVRGARALRARPLSRYLLVWAGFVVAFFSLSGTKLPHYVLYGSTPIFLLLACAAGEASRVARALTYGAIGLLLAAYGALPWLAQAAAPAIADPLYRELVSGAAALAPAYIPVGAGVAALGWAAAARVVRGFAARAAIGAAASALVLVTAVIPWVGDVLQGPVKRAAEVARTHPGPGVQWGVHVPSFSVYRKQVTPRSDPSEGQLAIVRADRLHDPDGDAVLFRERGYALVRWRARRP